MAAKRGKQRLYHKSLEKLDPELRHDRQVLTRKIQAASFWKKAVFELLANARLTAEEVQAELLKRNFRKEVSLDSVERVLGSLLDHGFLRVVDGRYAWNSD
ncbi:MAG: hypothetical protein Kow0069_36770 [Promethearchaeota archaeon]